jgi:hypothetical protein
VQVRTLRRARNKMCKGRNMTKAGRERKIKKEEQGMKE